MGEPHAGVDGEVVDALLGLLDQRVLEDLPIKLERIAVDLLERLVDRHRADRHRRVADDPAADVVDVAPGREVHDRVGAPADRPHHLVDLLGGGRDDGRVADIGVDLDEEIAADRHRLDFGMVDVGRDDRPPARHLVAHEFRRDEGRDRGAEALAVGKLLFGLGERGLAGEVLAVRDEDHLLGDDSGLGELVLRHKLARRPLADSTPRPGRERRAFPAKCCRCPPASPGAARRRRSRARRSTARARAARPR